MFLEKILKITFSKYKYYEDYNKSFSVNLKVNKSCLTIDNNSIAYSEYYTNDSKIIKIGGENMIFNIFSKNINFPLNNISFKYNKN